MPIVLDQLQAVIDDEQMQNLCNVAIGKKAALIVKAEADTPSSQGAERLEWAKQALASPSSYSKPVWTYMVGNNTAANVDQVQRSQGDPALPTDASIETNVAEAVDALWPIGT